MNLNYLDFVTNATRIERERLGGRKRVLLLLLQTSEKPQPQLRHERAYRRKQAMTQGDRMLGSRTQKTRKTRKTQKTQRAPKMILKRLTENAGQKFEELFEEAGMDGERDGLELRRKGDRGPTIVVWKSMASAKRWMRWYDDRDMGMDVDGDMDMDSDNDSDGDEKKKEEEEEEDERPEEAEEEEEIFEESEEEELELEPEPGLDDVGMETEKRKRAERRRVRDLEETRRELTVATSEWKREMQPMRRREMERREKEMARREMLRERLTKELLRKVVDVRRRELRENRRLGKRRSRRSKEECDRLERIVAGLMVEEEEEKEEEEKEEEKKKKKKGRMDPQIAAAFRGLVDGLLSEGVTTSAGEGPSE